MSTLSPKGKRLFISYKEATFNTPETVARFESYAMFPPVSSEPQNELDEGKVGTGQYGTRSELQAIWTPFTIEVDRLSEQAFFAGMCMGVSSIDGASPYKHQILGLAVANRLLPSFTMEYGDGSTNEVYSGCIVNEISLAAAAGGNGVAKMTVSGFCNGHTVTAGALALNTAGSIASGAESFASEPLVNFKCFNIYMGTDCPALTAATVVFTGENLTGTPTDISVLVNDFTIGYSNGLTPEDMARAGGCGILNDQNRKDPVVSFEMNVRKDTTYLNTMTLMLANTNKAFEFQYLGQYISGTDPYAIDFIINKAFIQGATKDGETPQSEAITFKCAQDAGADALEVYVQSNSAKSYTDTQA